MGEEDAEELDEMIRNSKEITWTTFKGKVGLREIRQMFPDYTYMSNRYNKGLHIKDDFAVSFHKYTFWGQPATTLYTPLSNTFSLT